MKGTIIGIGLKYGLAGGAFNQEAISIRDLVITDGGEIVSMQCLNGEINKRKLIDSGINTEAYSLISRVLEDGGEVIGFDCINNAISERKTIAAE